MKNLKNVMLLCALLFLLVGTAVYAAVEKPMARFVASKFTPTFSSSYLLAKGEKASTQSPKQKASILVDKATVMLGQGKKSQAASLLMKARKLDPKNINAWIMLGNLFLENKKYSICLATYRKALKQVPNSAELWFYYGFAQGKLGRYSVALKLFDKALSYNNEYADAFKYKGYSLMKLYRYKEAKDSFQKSLNLNSKDQYTRLFLGITTYESGDKETGKKIIEEALENKPQLKSQISDELKEILGI